MKKIQPNSRIVKGSDYSPAITLSEDKDIYRGINVFEKKKHTPKLMVHNNPDIDLVIGNEYKKFR